MITPLIEQRPVTTYVKTIRLGSHTTKHTAATIRLSDAVANACKGPRYKVTIDSQWLAAEDFREVATLFTELADLLEAKA